VVAGSLELIGHESVSPPDGDVGVSRLLRDRRPRALVVIADLPNPPMSGNHLRDLQTLEVVARLGYEVDVLAAVRSNVSGRGIGPYGVIVGSHYVPDEETTTTARMRRLWRLWWDGGRAGNPGAWGMMYDDAGFSDLIVATVRSITPNVLVLRSTLAHVLPTLRDKVGTIVLDAHDSEVLQAQTLLALSPRHRRLWDYARLRSSRRLELQMGFADEVWLPSERDASQLRSSSPRVRSIVVPNGVPVPLAPTRNPDPRPALVLIAGFGWRPNQAAASRLVERILPRVQTYFPEAHVTLVGRDLDSKLVRRWGNLPVTWLGRVESLGRIYETASAVVLPYDPSTATGTPLKVSEAVANKVPVVATPNASGPIGLRHDEHVLMAETDAGIAAAVCKVLENPAESIKRAERAHGWARKNLTAEAISTRLRESSVLALGAAGLPGRF
jgi:glycosyltransferase involved in cell wall biosynthesis